MMGLADKAHIIVPYAMPWQEDFVLLWDRYCFR